MSPCLSRGGKAYGLELGVMKSSSTSTWTSNNSSSPSSTLSESSNSPIFVCTRKPRTRRKRPNQKYKEAAALLSTAYPNVFSNKNLGSQPKFSPDLESTLLDEPMELLLPFQVFDKSEFLLNHDPILEDGKPGSRAEPEPEAKLSPLSEKPCQSPEEIEIQSNPMGFFDGCLEDFDESILDEDIEDGILDTVMGDLCVEGINDFIGEPNSTGFATDYGGQFDIGFGFGKGIEANALRNVRGTNDWWDFPFPTVDVFEISPTFGKSLLPNPVEKKKKKKKNIGKPKEEPQSGSEPVEADENTGEPTPEPKQNIGLLLKLNYDGIISAWSGRGSPFSDKGVGEDMQCADVPTRLAQIDLFPETGAVREASVQRYKEKRRTRLFSKKTRYEVRKANADQRLRKKGRFVRQQNSSSGRKR